MKRVDSSIARGFRVLAWPAIFSLGLAGCGRSEGASTAAKTASPASSAAAPAVPAFTADSRRPQAVTEKEVVATAERKPWPRTVRVQGSLWCDQRVIVGAKVAGRVKEVKVDLGDEVKPGEILASLELEEFQLRVQQAEAQVQQVRATLGLGPADDEKKLDPAKVPAVVQEQATWNEARGNWERGQGLQGIITKEELDQRKAAFDVAAARYEAALHGVQESLALLRVREAELGLARQALYDADIRAPIQAMVEQRLVNPGAYLQVGDAVVTLVKTDPLRFQAGVPELEAMRLGEQQVVRIFLEGRREPLEARITRISPSLDLASRSLRIEADVPNPDLTLRSGIFAEAEIVVEPEAQALAVPGEAVTEFAGVEKVRVARGGRIEERVVTTGRRGRWRAGNDPRGERLIETVRNDDPRLPGDQVEILDGLAEGDQIVYRKEEAGTEK
jgi:RND family efflux transporter MFP subunit